VQGFFIEIAAANAERVPRDYIRPPEREIAERFVTEGAESASRTGCWAHATRSASRARSSCTRSVLTQLNDCLGPLQTTAGALGSSIALTSLARARLPARVDVAPELVTEARIAI